MAVRIDELEQLNVPFDGRSLLPQPLLRLLH
jgi:hypothetical protein